MGELDVAENAARWAVFLDPTDKASRARLRDIGVHAGGSPQPSEEVPPLGTIWIEPASHRSLPLQQVGVHVARIVTSHVGSAADLNIIKRSRAVGLGHGLTVRIREIEDDGRIKGEIILVDEDMDKVDDEKFELTSSEARLSARDVPPIVTQRLSKTIDGLLERLRLELRKDRSR